jgi:lauroyl/myristoyl acyltransferase
MVYWLHRIGAPLSRLLPVWLTYAISDVFAPLVFALWREKREYAGQNMARVLGRPVDDREVQRLAVRSFKNYGKYLIDMLRLEGIPGAELERRVRIKGWEHFEQARDNSTGLIFVGGHIGNSDLAAAVLAGKGYPVNVIAEPLEPPRWDALVQSAREAAGLKVIPMGSHAIRFVRVLKANEILAFLIDRPVDEDGVRITFFGRETWVPGGAAALALRSGASLMGAYIVRSGHSYVADISPAIPPPSTGDPRRDLESFTQAIFDWLERVIRQHPDQWFMFRPMWPAEA